MPPLALLAGGLATRLQPLTATIPKSMLEVAGEPFIAHQLRWLQRQNIRDIVICIGFLGEAIHDFVGTGERFGVHVRYSPDGETLLGTGGALRKTLSLLGDVFFVMYGDSYLPTDFAAAYDAFQRNDQASGLMTVFRNEGKWDKSNVMFREGRILAYDKRHPAPDMQHIDYGLGVLTTGVFNDWPGASAFDLADVYASLVKQNRLAGYEVAERFYEIGSPQGLAEASAFLAAGTR